MTAFPAVDANERYAEEPSHLLLSETETLSDCCQPTVIQHFSNIHRRSQTSNKCYNNCYKPG